jgi:anion-transporting  ArsA/GET3 family ATPase
VVLANLRANRLVRSDGGRVDLRGFCTSTRLFIVAGKGGVGKTTVTASLARMASLAGLDTLIVEVEGRSGLGEAFGRPGVFDYEEAVLVPAGQPDHAGAVRARTLTPDDALTEYLDEHGMRRISRRLTKSGAIDVVSTAIPGVKDILVLGKVKQLERGGGDDDSGPPDLILIDAPAAGHAVTFLQSAHGLLDAVRVGPIRTQAQEVVDMLTDPARCQVMLVTLPEETPVNELVETAYSLEDKVGIKLAPVVVNGLYPVLEGLDADPGEVARAAKISLTPAQAATLATAAAFRRQRQELQAEQVARLADALPLAQLRLPYVFSEAIGPDEVETLAGALANEVVRLP